MTKTETVIQLLKLVGGVIGLTLLYQICQKLNQIMQIMS
jgi:hypothetical protein